MRGRELIRKNQELGGGDYKKYLDNNKGIINYKR